jgi:hypothetical protein
MASARKIIQVAIDASGTPAVIYALCDDGTLWCRFDLEGRQWLQVEDVPQPWEEA